MTRTATGECPKEGCDGEVTVEFFTERHRVNVGIGMVTVGEDHWEELTETTCEHDPYEDYNEEERDRITANAAESYAQEKYDYEAEQYDRMKDEGEI